MTRLLKTFKNKEVTISVTGVKSKGSPIGIVGTFLDFDGTFIYLGEEVDGEIVACVPYNKVGTILVNDLALLGGSDDDDSGVQ